MVQIGDVAALAEVVRPERHDTLTARVGGEYEIDGYATLRAGVIYDQASSPVSTMTPDAPDGDRLGFTLGAGRELIAGLGPM